MKTLSLCPFLCLFINSCEPSSECQVCQEATDHMAEKIGDYACNPAYMQNAWDRINKDCGVWGDTYVCYMTETCFYQNSEYCFLHLKTVRDLPELRGPNLVFCGKLKVDARP